MAITKYNKALDYTVLALAHAVNGDLERAGRCMVKASKASDVTAAVAILEASNQQAYDGEQRAKRKLAAAAKASKPVTKPAAAAPKVAAAARVKASSKVVAFDMGDEDDMDELIEDDDIEVEAEEAEDGADISDDEDDTEQDGEDRDFDKAFASVLKGMNGGKAGKRK